MRIKLIEKSNYYFEQGLQQQMLGFYEDAIKSYDKCINLDARFVGAYSNRGAVKYLLQQYLPSLEDYNQAIKLNHKFANAYYGRAIVKIKLNRHNEAVIDFDKSIKLNPKDSDSFAGRGQAKDKSGQYLSAIKDFNLALSFNSKSALALHGRGISRCNLGQYDFAIRDFNFALEINPQNSDVYNSRGVAKASLQMFDAAVIDFSQAIKLNHKDTDAYFGRGMANYNLKKYPLAIEDYNYILTKNFKHFHALIFRGNAYDHLGEKVKAITDYCMAIPYSMGLLSTKQHHVKASQLMKFRKVNADNLQAIRNSQVWFSHPSKFPDIHDGTYLLRRFPQNKSVEQAVKSLMVYSCFGRPAEDVASSHSNSSKDINIMWAEYGNASKGICLHYLYNPEKSLKPKLFSFDKITYIESVSDEENVSLYDTLQQGFFTKYSKWDFENEYRFLTTCDDNLNNIDNQIAGKLVSEIDLGLTLIAVDFGVNCSDNDKQNVFDAAMERGKSESISFYQLSITASFEFYRTEILR